MDSFVTLKSDFVPFGTTKKPGGQAARTTGRSPSDPAGAHQNIGKISTFPRHVSLKQIANCDVEKFWQNFYNKLKEIV